MSMALSRSRKLLGSELLTGSTTETGAGCADRRGACPAERLDLEPDPDPGIRKAPVEASRSKGRLLRSPLS
jgi:hypothetical protein